MEKFEKQQLEQKLFVKIERGFDKKEIATGSGFLYQKFNQLYFVTLAHNIFILRKEDKEISFYNQHIKKPSLFQKVSFYKNNGLDVAVAKLDSTVISKELILFENDVAKPSAGDSCLVYSPLVSPFVFSKGPCMGGHGEQFLVDIKLCDGMSGCLVKIEKGGYIGMAAATGATELGLFELHLGKYAESKDKKDRKQNLERLLENLLFNETYAKVVNFKAIEDVIKEAEEFFEQNEKMEKELQELNSYAKTREYLEEINGLYECLNLNLVGTCEIGINME